MRADILEKQEQVEVWISEHRSKSYMYRQLKCQPSTFDNYLKVMGLEYEGNKGGKGHKIDSKRKPASYFLENEVPITSYKLKHKLFQDKVKEEKCESCGIENWNGQKAPLQLHHVDGNRYNNVLNNLQILCANCHCLTDNHSGKSSKKASVGKRKSRLT